MLHVFETEPIVPVDCDCEGLVEKELRLDWTTTGPGLPVSVERNYSRVGSQS